MTLLDQIRIEKLIQLASERFGTDIDEAEIKILRDSAKSLDAEASESDSPRPVIRPEFLRWFVTDPEASLLIDPRGFRVFAVTIPGDLELQQCCIGFPLMFYFCTF